MTSVSGHTLNIGSYKVERTINRQQKNVVSRTGFPIRPHVSIKIHIPSVDLLIQIAASAGAFNVVYVNQFTGLNIDGGSADDMSVFDNIRPGRNVS